MTAADKASGAGKTAAHEASEAGATVADKASGAGTTPEDEASGAGETADEASGAGKMNRRDSQFKTAKALHTLGSADKMTPQGSDIKKFVC